jgi:isoamylase
MKSVVDTGRSFLLGATVATGGVNFSLYSRSATGVELLFFDRKDDAMPSRVVRFDPVMNRTCHYWHTFVPNVASGQLYGFLVDGPHMPARGLRFDSEKVLLDSYGKGVVVPVGYNRHAATEPGDNTVTAMKSVVVDPAEYDWGGDQPLHLPSARTIIYEMHVRGFTRHPSSRVCDQKRGTYAGLIEKIPYLKELGITAVELLPVFQFDALDCPPGKINYWGYAPISFFAPHHAFSSQQTSLGPVNEFRDMVKALRRAGIEIILDVVFNHTAEGDQRGPSLCFRGIDNPTYYILEGGGEWYANYTGCGNTLNANHPIVRRMIVDSLRYWVEHMHVDGFRFDLASILSRDANGQPLPDPPVLWDIDSDPALAGTKLIAEALDAAGLYQVGSFVGDAWKEWNGKFRDDVRDFFRGEPGSLRRVADRIVGSPEIYSHKLREAEQSVNFVTCHDGFTLNDLVSYNDKHNEANGEDNRDGANDNRSWNCGTIQLGNNNVYCQDNELSWFDWALVEKNADLHRLDQLLCARRALRSTRHEQQLASLQKMLRDATKTWHGVKLNEPDWGDDSLSVALNAELREEGLDFHLILNAYWEPLTFQLPSFASTKSWRRWIDTSLVAPNDIVPWEKASPIPGDSYRVADRSEVMLYSQRDGHEKVE